MFTFLKDILCVCVCVGGGQVSLKDILTKLLHGLLIFEELLSAKCLCQGQ